VTSGCVNPLRGLYRIYMVILKGKIFTRIVVHGVTGLDQPEIECGTDNLDLVQSGEIGIAEGANQRLEIGNVRLRGRRVEECSTE